MSARDNAIKKFTEDPDCRIFLMSLKAGGVALNLTVASHVSIFCVLSCLELCYIIKDREALLEILFQVHMNLMRRNSRFS